MLQKERRCCRLLSFLLAAFFIFSYIISFPIPVSAEKNTVVVNMSGCTSYSTIRFYSDIEYKDLLGEVTPGFMYIYMEATTIPNDIANGEYRVYRNASYAPFLNLHPGTYYIEYLNGNATYKVPITIPDVESFALSIVDITVQMTRLPSTDSVTQAGLDPADFTFGGKGTLTDPQGNVIPWTSTSLFPAEENKGKDPPGDWEWKLRMQGPQEETNYTFTYTPADDRLESYTTTIPSTSTNVQHFTSTYAQNEFTFQVPEEYADNFQLYQKKQHYTPFTKIDPEPGSVTSNGTTSFVYNIPHGSYHYIIRRDESENNLKLGRIIQLNKYSPNTIVVRGYSKTPADYGSTDGWKNGDWTHFDFDESVSLPKPSNEEDNLYLNVDDNSYMRLNQIGDTQKIEAFRLKQAVTDSVGNYFMEPDFHYEVAGNSVEVTEPADSQEGRRYVNVKAVANGVSLIKVTYDPMYWSHSSTDGLSESPPNATYYSGINPVNTRVVVVNVGGHNNAGIDMGINQDDYSEYDTIYYNKNTDEYAEFEFTPTSATGAELTVRVHDPVYDGGATWGSAWTSYDANVNGSYTVHLKDGRNIIEVSANDGSKEYYVVNCRALDVQIANITRPDASEGDYQVGDTIEISFDGLSLPVQKMAGIYNPNYPAQGWVEYQTNTGRTLRSEGRQYDAVTKEYSKLTYTLTDAGQFQLLNGRIHNMHLGSELDFHRNIPLEGMGANMEAVGGSNDPYFSTLPVITLNVKQNADVMQESFMYAQLQSWEVNGKNTSLAAASREELNAVRNVNQIDELYLQEGGDDLTETDIVITPHPYHPDGVTITARYRTEDETTWTPYDGTLTPDVENIILEGVSTKEVYWVEVTVTPKDANNGEPHTYCLRLLQGQEDTISTKKARPILTNLAFAWGDQTVTEPNGLLKANGADDNLGYGLLSGRYDYTLTVPEDVDTISVLTTTSALSDQNVGPVGTIDNIALTDGHYPDCKVSTEQTTYRSYTAEGNKSVQQREITNVSTNEGTITITLRDNFYYETTYTINVVTAESGNYTFSDLLEGSSLALESIPNRVRVNPAADGSYALSAGEMYTYVYSCPGYVTETGYITVPALQDGEATPKDLTNLLTGQGKLQPVEQEKGTATVRIAGYEEMFVSTTTVNIDPLCSTTDLYAKGYVKYNVGGYTVLHALVEAMGDKAFDCTNGEFVPTLTITDPSPADGAGWVCEVNGKVVESPWQTLLEPGAKVEFYWNSNHVPMQHAWLAPETKQVEQGDTVTLTLFGTQVKNDGRPGGGIADATIYVDGEEVGKTDSSGMIDIDTTNLSKGSHSVTAKKIQSVTNSQEHKNILTYALSTITIGKAGESTTEDTVTFRLIGSTIQTEDPENGVDFSQAMGNFTGAEDNTWGTKYVTWIATTEYDLNGATNVTVGDVFKYMLDNAGFKYEGLEKNYISSITTPDGTRLSEMDNGRRSGWMYTVNGVHPGSGLTQCTVSAGDEIIWHYVNDYLYEVSDWSSDNSQGIGSGSETGGSRGTDAVWNKWLEAEDKAAFAGVIAYLLESIQEEDITIESDYILLAISAAGAEVPDKIKAAYRTVAEEAVGNDAKNLDPSEIASIIHAYDAMGETPVVNGINLLDALVDGTDWVTKESANAADATAKALMAMDAHEHTNDDVRKTYRDFLLENQIKDGEHTGAWKNNPGIARNNSGGLARMFSFRSLLSVGAAGTADPCLDTTLTVLRSLAPYYDESNQEDEVYKTVQSALDWLKKYQKADGGFSESGNSADVISTAKAIAALSVLGIDPESFNGKNVVAALVQFEVLTKVGETTYKTYGATSGAKTTDNDVTGEVAEALHLLEVAGSLSDGSGSTAKPVDADLQEIYEDTRDYLLTLEPGTGSIGGEWMMLGLARALAIDDDEGLTEYLEENLSTYLAAVKEMIEDTSNRSNTFAEDGRLHKYKPTENERVALALLSLGVDPTNFDGYNLMKALEDVDWVNDQGVNSTTFALIAMQACEDAEFTNYTFNPEVRDKLIERLKETQIKSGADAGGWNIETLPDGQGYIDTVAMVLPALAPYYDTNSDAKEMVDAALAWLKKQPRDSNGGFGSSIEANAQVIVALTSLGIDPESSEWCTADGKSALDALKAYYVEDGNKYGFEHEYNQGHNQMSTEQGFYALVAYFRWNKDKSSLYDMSETSETEISEYTIKVSVPTGGTLKVSVSSPSATTTQLSTNARANEGDTIKVTVTPDEGYRMVEGSLVYTKDDAGSAPVSIDESTLTFTMPASDITISCKWEKVDGEDPEDPDDSVKPAITEFWIGQFEGIIDQESNSIVVTLPLDAKLRGIVPKITTENTESMSPGKGEAVNFDGSAVKYNLVGTDGVTTRTYTVTIQLDNEMYFEKLWDQVEDLRDESGWWDKAESNKQSPGNDYKDYWSVR